jgi:hypothetical protein
MQKLFLLAVCFVLISPTTSEAGGILAHRRLVAASGLTPPQVGTHEGVGMSTRSAKDAIQNACYWGQRQPLFIQTTYRNGRYYAVVRY